MFATERRTQHDPSRITIAFNCILSIAKHRYWALLNPNGFYIDKFQPFHLLPFPGITNNVRNGPIGEFFLVAGSLTLFPQTLFCIRRHSNITINFSYFQFFLDEYFQNNKPIKQIRVLGLLLMARVQKLQKTEGR